MASLYSTSLWALIHKVLSVDIFSIVLLNGRLVSVFFAKFNEVSSEAGNLRMLLEPPWNLLGEKGSQASMRFEWGLAILFEWLFRDIYRRVRPWGSMDP